MRRDSTNCACGSGAVTRRIGSLAKKTVPSGIAWTSPVKRKLAQVVEKIPAEPAGALEPFEFRRREAQVFEVIERLLESGRNEKSAAGGQAADEEFENGGFGLAMVQIGLDHVDLVEVGE